MSINTKRELVLRFRREYQAASRQKKSKLLNSLIEATGYNRKYAVGLLNQAPRARPAERRIRKSKYGRDVVDAVRLLWRAANGICAKRLLPFLPTLIETLERCGHMKLNSRLKKTILEMSLSTLERILKYERDKQSKGISLTRPGSLLKKQVAVKTFAEWSDQQIGFLEVDLVAHCGGDISGHFMQTLTMTDIASGWTEVAPLLRGTGIQVRAAMEQILNLLPFKLKGIDCDNGKEFLNHEMVTWCRERRITFTRSRAYRKNDQAHVEEKNGSVVRRLIGYDRFEGRAAFEVMTELYSVSRLYINYFQPSMKLIKKTRIGSKVTKQYDTARTPLERLLDFETLPKSRKAVLQREFLRLDPLALLTEMARLQSKLWHLASARPGQEIPTMIIEPTQHNDTGHRKRRIKHRLASKSDNSKTAAQYSMPLSDARESGNRIGYKRGRKDLENGRIELTDGFIASLSAPSQHQVIYRDSKLVRFGLRITRGGSKSFVVECRVNGSNRRITIGRADLFSVEEARNEAVHLLRHMVRGIEPITLRTKPKGN